MITLEEVLFLHTASVKDFGGSDGIRDLVLLESAVERPTATFDGIELYSTPAAKSASILEIILKNHPFVDGNKRTGWLACATLLRFYGYRFTLTEDEAYDFVIKVASSQMQFEEIEKYISNNIKRIL